MADSSTKFLLPPSRGEKRIVPIPVDVTSLPVVGRSGGGETNPLNQTLKSLGGLGAFGKMFRSGEQKQSYTNATGELPVTPASFDQSRVAAISRTAAGLTDYITVRLRGRGLDGSDLVWRFLVNPETITINRQVVDGEALTRSGLQTGIWGDTLDVTLQGTTAGQYFAGVVVDTYAEYSASARNLLELMAIYENNGAWFEGEVTGNLAAAHDATRKQIQLQGDVILTFGNFIWHGCFTDMQVDNNATSPYLNKFSLSFMAWKERFAKDSPWRDSIRTTQYFGHAYELYVKAPKPETKPTPADTEATTAADEARKSQKGAE